MILKVREANITRAHTLMISKEQLLINCVDATSINLTKQGMFSSILYTPQQGIVFLICILYKVTLDGSFVK